MRKFTIMVSAIVLGVSSVRTSADPAKAKGMCQVPVDGRVVISEVIAAVQRLSPKQGLELVRLQVDTNGAILTVSTPSATGMEPLRGELLRSTELSLLQGKSALGRASKRGGQHVCRIRFAPVPYYFSPKRAQDFLLAEPLAIIDQLLPYSGVRGGVVSAQEVETTAKASYAVARRTIRLKDTSLTNFRLLLHNVAVAESYFLTAVDVRFSGLTSGAAAKGPRASTATLVVSAPFRL